MDVHVSLNGIKNRRQAIRNIELTGWSFDIISSLYVPKNPRSSMAIIRPGLDVSWSSLLGRASLFGDHAEV